ncbi:yippee zinc-binding/DNA-binding /Mis18, centromere assembly-domain-containing protein [Xylariaceae sp. FL0804]|nr:yippee zinc-binding/DNA-binding /Mis18, centromere assembly-domain-containing protein [Xylariaceae sp. FL0804]
MLSMVLSGEVPVAPPPAVNAGPKFPTYLLPSLPRPFRRRRQSSLSSCGSPPGDDEPPSLSNSPTESVLSGPVENPRTPSAARFSFSRAIFNRAPAGPVRYPKLARTQPNTLRCSTCGTDFAFSSQIVSKGFTGRYGRAYLVSPPERPPKKKQCEMNLINIKVGKSETRLLVTGSHVVADIFCNVCSAKVGWKYVDAKEESQQYKVGKFILETQRVVDYRSWEDNLDDELPQPAQPQEAPMVADDDTIVFDSDDEEECEDIFLGTWDSEVVARRRGRKLNKRMKKADD